MFRFIRSKVETDEDAEDILQDVWQQFSLMVDTEPVEQISSWLFKVARNRIIDSYRKKKPELLEDLIYEDEDGEVNFKEILLVDNATPETEHLKQLFWQELFNALNQLPEEQRQVFIENELEERTFQQIADNTGENIKTLISRKRYAVMHLRERLATLYHEIINQ